MEKIPTIFVRDETQRGHPVTPTVKPECQWVLEGEGLATIKVDGQNVKVEGGVLYKRQKPKERDYDNAAYIPCDRNDPGDRWLWEAFDHATMGTEDAIYEAVGPKIQGGASGHDRHDLIPVVPFSVLLVDLSTWSPVRTFDGLREWLEEHAVEGLVFHNSDGRMAKIKRRDFGLKWPIKD